MPLSPGELYELADSAFGEYLHYLDVPGVVESENSGSFSYAIEVPRVDGVAELPLLKNASAVERLLEADLSTANQEIRDIDGVQHFVNLEALRLTSNAIEELDLSSNVALRELEMNFNVVGVLDLSSNTELRRLRYQASARAKTHQKLQSVDLSNNRSLRHLSLPNHAIVAIDLRDNLLIDEALDLSGNPGPDGDPDTPDIVVPDRIYRHVPESMRAGVTSDAFVDAEVSLATSATAIPEADGFATIEANLNLVSPDDVEVTLIIGGTAQFDTDYDLEDLLLTIPSGSTRASTSLRTLDDDHEEGIEVIEVMLGAIENAAPSGASRVSIHIVQDDFDIGLVLNEVLYDPSNASSTTDEALPGDANNDGFYVQDEDEFIELVNVSTAEIDLSGFEVYDTEAETSGVPRHVFEEETRLPAGAALVLFGGGKPTGDFGEAQVLTASSGAMNLNNAGDVLSIVTSGGRVAVLFDTEPRSNNPNESYTRDPDLVGDFVQHAVTGSALFSPGTRIDGSPF